MTIKTISDASEFKQINYLIYQNYLSQNYIYKNQYNSIQNYHLFDNNDSTQTYAISHDDKLISSISITSCSVNTPINKVFAPTMSKLNEDYPTVATVWRLISATTPKAHLSSRKLIRHAINKLIKEHGANIVCTIAFFTKLEPFYTRALGGKIIDRQWIKDDGIFKENQVALMLVKPEDISRWISN